MINQINSNGIIEYLSPFVYTILGFYPEQMPGKSFFSFIHPEESLEVETQFNEGLKNNAPLRIDYRFRKTNNDYIEMESIGNPIKDMYLTGLSHRYFFEEEMKRMETGRFHPLGIIVCDIDGLKWVNDTFGHSFGDKLITAMANLLQELVRTSDIVARVEEDEFAILLPQCPESKVHDLAEEIKNSLSGKYLPGTGIPLMMSVGCSSNDMTDRSMKDLYIEADTKMYEEKTINRERF